MFPCSGQKGNFRHAKYDFTVSHGGIVSLGKKGFYHRCNRNYCRSVYITCKTVKLFVHLIVQIKLKVKIIFFSTYYTVRIIFSVHQCVQASRRTKVIIQTPYNLQVPESY